MATVLQRATEARRFLSGLAVIEETSLHRKQGNAETTETLCRGTDQVTETETGPQDFILSQSFCFFKARKLPLPAETETGGECRVFWYVSEAQKLGISCRISRIQKLGRNTQISDRNPEIFVADGKFLLPAPPYANHD
jgi:hypothetical protein